jgi:hypothetical protein
LLTKYLEEKNMKLKTFKKLVAGVVATALVGATMVVTPVSATVHEVPDTYTATLNGQLGEVGFWDADGPSCTVTGDGSYSLTYTYTGNEDILNDPSEGGDNVAVILLLDFDTYTLGDGTTAEGTGIVLNVTSVTLGGTDLNYSGSCVAPAYTRADDGKTLKLNIYNTWNKAQYTQDISNLTSKTIKSGETLTVNFNVSGLTDAIARAKEVNSIVTTADTQNSQVSSNSDSSTDSSTTTTANGSSDNSSTTTTTTTSADGATTTTTTTASGDSSSSSNGNSSSGNSSSSNSSSSSDSGSSSDSSSDSSTATESTATDTSDTTTTGLGIVLVVSLAGVMFTRRNHK